jgi:hypothetical protein
VRLEGKRGTIQLHSGTLRGRFAASQARAPVKAADRLASLARRNRAFTWAIAANALWEAFLKGQNLPLDKQAWREAAEKLGTSMRPILDFPRRRSQRRNIREAVARGAQFADLDGAGGGDLGDDDLPEDERQRRPTLRRAFVTFGRHGFRRSGGAEIQGLTIEILALKILARSSRRNRRHRRSRRRPPLRLLGPIRSHRGAGDQLRPLYVGAGRDP